MESELTTGMSDLDYFGHLEIIIEDGSLPLGELQDFAKEYPLRFGGEVRITSRWGGPAATGLDLPEVAVLIVMGELLRRLSSDAYDFVKTFILDKYTAIRTRQGARWYVDGALALAVDSKLKALRVLFVLPEGLSQQELGENLKRVERDFEGVLQQWEAKPWIQEDGDAVAIKLCWNREAERWEVCSEEFVAWLQARSLQADS